MKIYLYSQIFIPDAQVGAVEVVSSLAVRALEVVAQHSEDSLALGLPPAIFAGASAEPGSEETAASQMGGRGDGSHAQSAGCADERHLCEIMNDEAFKFAGQGPIALFCITTLTPFKVITLGEQPPPRRSGTCTFVVQESSYAEQCHFRVPSCLWMLHTQRPVLNVWLHQPGCLAGRLPPQGSTLRQ